MSETPSLTVAPSSAGDRLRALLDEFYAGRRGHPSWAAQEVQLLMAEGGPLATLLSSHASALSAERARVEAATTRAALAENAAGIRKAEAAANEVAMQTVVDALAAMTAERDRLTAEVARKDAALKPFAALWFSFDGFSAEPAALVFQRSEYGQWRCSDHAAFQKMIDAAGRALTPITDGETR